MPAPEYVKDPTTGKWVIPGHEKNIVTGKWVKTETPSEFAAKLEKQMRNTNLKQIKRMGFFNPSSNAYNARTTRKNRRANRKSRKAGRRNRKTRGGRR